MNDVKFFGVHRNNLMFQRKPANKFVAIAYEIENIDEYIGNYVSLCDFKDYVIKNKQREATWDFKNDNIIMENSQGLFKIFGNIIKCNSEKIECKEKLKEILIDEIGLNHRFNSFWNESEMLLSNIQFLVIFKAIQGVERRVARNILKQILQNPEISKMDKQDTEDYLRIVIENNFGENE